jgi:hypothetical protein
LIPLVAARTSASVRRSISAAVVKTFGEMRTAFSPSRVAVVV